VPPLVRSAPWQEAGARLQCVVREGVRQDKSKTFRWYRNAAEQGFPEAQVGLGLLYESGGAVSQDTAEAVRGYRMAAEGGYQNAQAALGRLTGEPTPAVPKP
jgi:TPR repeat protein